MDFNFTPEQDELRKTIREFAAEKIAPHSRKWDKEGIFPMDVIRELGKMGVMGMTIDPKYGGAGLDVVSMAIVIEELARVDGSVTLTVASHNSLGSGHIYKFGNDAQKQKYIPTLARGEKLAAWGLTEPGSGSDASGMKTRAVKKGTNWIINGSKCFITQGTVGDVYVVLASTTPEKKQSGITAFILEKGMPGFTIGKKEDKLGLRASDTATLSFENVEVSDDHRLGEVDHGFLNTLKILDGGRIGIGAMSIGLGLGALQVARDYAKTRHQFGVPIIEHQSIRNILVERYVELQAAKMLILKVASMAADGVSDHSFESAQAKLYASYAGRKACYDAIQVLGGYGFLADYPVERLYRDVKLCEIGEGTSEVQRMVIAKHLLG